MRLRRATGWILCLLGAIGGQAEPLREFAGGPARVVWCQQVDEGSGDAMARTDSFRLMGYDSEDGLGERPLLDAVRNYHKPLLSPDGATIVFSDWGQRRFYALDWSGANLREAGPGMAVDVWRDPQSGRTWIYAITREYYWERFRGTDLRRFALDDLSVSEPVWDATVVSADNFQLSEDGRYAGGVFPWPDGAVADLAEGTLSKRGRGCWASLAPDNSRLYWLFDGAHRNLLMFGAEGTPRWRINISGAPGIGGHEVYHPRWSNHARYFAMTGPYTIRVAGKNAIHGGGDDVEIHVGRFAADHRSVESWLRLTQNGRGDFFPDLWVGASAQDAVASAGAEVSGEIAARPAPFVEAELTLLQCTPVPDPTSIEPYQHALVFHDYRVERVVSGELTEERIMVGHWGIRDGAKVERADVVGARHTLWVSPLEAWPELEGERQLIEIDDLTLPAYVEVPAEDLSD